MALTTRPSQPSEGRTAAGDRRDDGAAAAPHAFERAERHQERIVAGKADDLAGDRAAGRGLDQHLGADRHGVDRSRDLDHQAAHADHPAVDLDAVQFSDLFGERFHVDGAPPHAATGIHAWLRAMAGLRFAGG